MEIKTLNYTMWVSTIKSKLYINFRTLKWIIILSLSKYLEYFSTLLKVEADSHIRPCYFSPKHITGLKLLWLIGNKRLFI